MGSNILQMLKSLKSRVEIFEGGNGKTFFFYLARVQSKKVSFIKHEKKHTTFTCMCKIFQPSFQQQRRHRPLRDQNNFK